MSAERFSKNRGDFFRESCKSTHCIGRLWLTSSDHTAPIRRVSSMDPDGPFKLIIQVVCQFSTTQGNQGIVRRHQYAGRKACFGHKSDEECSAMFGNLPEGRERKSLSPLRRGVLMDSIEMDCASLYTILVRVLHWKKRRNADWQTFVLHSLLLSSLESLDSSQTSSI